MFAEGRGGSCEGSAFLGAAGQGCAAERVHGRLSEGVEGGGQRSAQRLALVQISHQPPHLLQSLRLHEDVVLGQEQGGDFGEFPHRGAVGIRDNGAQPVQGIVQVVHPPPLPRVDAEPQRALLLRLLAQGSPLQLALPLEARTALHPGFEAVLLIAALLAAALCRLAQCPGVKVRPAASRVCPPRTLGTAADGPVGESRWPIARGQRQVRLAAQRLELGHGLGGEKPRSAASALRMMRMKKRRRRPHCARAGGGQ